MRTKTPLFESGLRTIAFLNFSQNGLCEEASVTAALEHALTRKLQHTVAPAVYLNGSAMRTRDSWSASVLSPTTDLLYLVQSCACCCPLPRENSRTSLDCIRRRTCRLWCLSDDAARPHRSSCRHFVRLPSIVSIGERPASTERRAAWTSAWTATISWSVQGTSFAIQSMA